MKAMYSMNTKTEYFGACERDGRRYVGRVLTETQDVALDDERADEDEDY